MIVITPLIIDPGAIIDPGGGGIGMLPDMGLGGAGGGLLTPFEFELGIGGAGGGGGAEIELNDVGPDD